MTQAETYIPDKPCQHCKTRRRYTKHGGCVRCAADRANIARQANRERHYIEDWHKRMAGVNYQTEKTTKLGIL